MGEKQLRCGDCKCCVPDQWRSADGSRHIEFLSVRVCASPKRAGEYVNPGQYACRWFVYKDK